MNKNILVVHEVSVEQRLDLLELYKNEYWTHDRVEKDLDVILSKASFIIGLVDITSNKLIGFTRGLTDYFRFAYIYDVIVHPDYRSLGLGRKLMKLALEYKDIQAIRNIELVCKEDMMPFYQDFGFSENYGSGLIAMRKRNISENNGL